MSRPSQSCEWRRLRPFLIYVSGWREVTMSLHLSQRRAKGGLALRSVAIAALFGFVAVGTGAAQAPKALAWPHTPSDIPADPAVKFGALENGRRYGIMKNATPPGQVSMRLRIG